MVAIAVGATLSWQNIRPIISEAGHILFLRILYPIHIQAPKRILYQFTITPKKRIAYMYILFISFVKKFVPKV
jgi:hypothetical protein